MAIHRVSGYVIASALLGSLCTLIFASCGTSSTTTASTTSTTAKATATACAQQFRGANASGTIKSIAGNTLVITKRAGGTAQVTLSSTTRITREEQVAPSAIQEGTTAIVRVKKNADSTYTATTIALSNGTTAFGANPSGTPAARGAQGANNPCFSAAGRTGTPVAGRAGGRNGGNFGRNGGNFGGNGGNGNNGGNTTDSQTLNGTVGQVSKTSLTVTDRSGNDYTVSLNSSTQIVQTSTVAASTLQQGMNVTINGTPDSQGVIAARTISILLANNTSTTGGQS